MTTLNSKNQQSVLAKGTTVYSISFGEVATVVSSKENGIYTIALKGNGQKMEEERDQMMKIVDYGYRNYDDYCNAGLDGQLVYCTRCRRSGIVQDYDNFNLAIEDEDNGEVYYANIHDVILDEDVLAYRKQGKRIDLAERKDSTVGICK